MNASLFKNWISFIAVMAVFAVGGTAKAAVLAIESSSQGWYRTAGIGGRDNLTNGAPGFAANTFTGVFEGVEHRSFFTFDLGETPSFTTGLTLSLPTEFYFSGDPAEEIQIFDVDTPGSLLTSNPSDSLALDIFDDLGSGTFYGDSTISRLPGEVQPNNSVRLSGTIDITLSDDAVDDFNRAQYCEDAEDFSLGVILSSVPGIPILDGNPERSAEGVRFSLRPSDPRAQLLVDAEDPTVGSSGSSYSCDKKPPVDPEPVPEPGTLMGLIAAVGAGIATLKSGKGTRREKS